MDVIQPTINFGKEGELWCLKKVGSHSVIIFQID